MSGSQAQSHSQFIEPSRNSSARGMTILVVEDEDSVREFVRLVLERAGYSVVTAEDGDHGFAEFVANPDRFALVLSDVIMPNRTGPELCVLIDQVKPGVPVVFMSAYTGGTSAIPIEMPADATVLEKPFSLDQLLHAVALAISQKGK